MEAPPPNSTSSLPPEYAVTAPPKAVYASLTHARIPTREHTRVQGPPTPTTRRNILLSLIFPSSLAWLPRSLHQRPQNHHQISCGGGPRPLIIRRCCQAGLPTCGHIVDGFRPRVGGIVRRVWMISLHHMRVSVGKWGMEEGGGIQVLPTPLLLRWTISTSPRLVTMGTRSRSHVPPHSSPHSHYHQSLSFVLSDESYLAHEPP